VTVSELVEHLSQFPADIPVLIDGDAFKYVSEGRLTITGVLVLGHGEWAEEIEYALFNALDELPESKAYESWNNEYHAAEAKLRADFDSVRPPYPDGFVS